MVKPLWASIETTDLKPMAHLLSEPIIIPQHNNDELGTMPKHICLTMMVRPELIQ